MKFRLGRKNRRADPACSIIVLFLGFVLAGCSAGSGDDLDISGRPLGERGDVPLAPTLASIQANLFDPFCIVCHSGAGAPLGLRLDTASSFTNLVGVPSRQNGSLLRVEPGSPDRSYLVRKLEGSAAEGEQMPLGGPSVPQTTIDFVRQWIQDGALDDTGGPPPNQPPVVVSLSPTPASNIADFPAEIIAGFDRELDASTVNNLTFLLTRSGGDGQFGDIADFEITASSVALSALNPRLAIMELAGVPAVDDLYRVTVKGSGSNVVLSVGGTALDGEFSGMLPSGDGVAGGDFVAEFEIEGLQPSLTSIQANVFAASCAFSGCHSGPADGSLPTGMDLTSADASYSSLVGVTSVEEPTLQRVMPEDPDASYLVQKLEGTAATGDRMPLGGPFLDQASIDVIRLWIENGADR